MTPNYPRPAEIPANFIFIGQGGKFTPVKEDRCWFVKPNACLSCNMKYGQDVHKTWYSDCDFYVKKNGPTHKLNTPKKLRKNSKYIVAKNGITWVVNKDGGVFGHFATRKIARKAAKALNQFES